MESTSSLSSLYSFIPSFTHSWCWILPHVGCPNMELDCNSFPSFHTWLLSAHMGSTFCDWQEVGGVLPLGFNCIGGCSSFPTLPCYTLSESTILEFGIKNQLVITYNFSLYHYPVALYIYRVAQRDREKKDLNFPFSVAKFNLITRWFPPDFLKVKSSFSRLFKGSFWEVQVNSLFCSYVFPFVWYSVLKEGLFLDH